ncbi:mechanosensitive ion channel domain-containing protein [uncultured Lutibacter sp.]|uniref:mechanosensitive ion channel family protein n=1 Tax=uncultured Lutibacter sp. TaxID=437739 RepID=UPI0026291F8A|nr:mechanosensitive ion channel domain-containing protein [uncultured Lutibacter sp.]
MEQLNQFFQSFKVSEQNAFLLVVLQFALWACLILFFSWIIKKSITKKITDNPTRYRIKKIISLVSYALIILLVVISFTGKVQYFTVSIGLISAGIAFTLQEVILSTAGWFAIFSTNIYKPGDRIELNGVKGDVIDVGITKTTLMEIGEWVNSDNYSGRIVQISNSFIFKGSVHNYSTDFPFVWDEINLPIKYNSDIVLTKQLILDVAENSLATYAQFAKKHWQHMVQKYMIEDAIIKPTLTLKLTDNWIEFNLRYIVDYKKRRLTKNELFSQIYERINNTNGKVELASATFEVVGFPNLNINNKINT